MRLIEKENISNKLANKLKENVLDNDTRAVYLMTKDRNKLYTGKADPVVLSGINTYISWNLYLIAGKNGDSWITPDGFSEDENYESFLQYPVTESLKEAAEANDFIVVTADDINIEEITQANV